MKNANVTLITLIYAYLNVAVVEYGLIPSFNQNLTLEQKEN